MERLMIALLELSLPMAVVIAVLLAAGPLLGRRFTARWRYWAWLLIAVRLLLPIGISLPQPVVTLPQPQVDFSYPVREVEPISPTPTGDPILVLPGDDESDPYQQIGAETTAPTVPDAVSADPVFRPNQPQPVPSRTVTAMELTGWCWAAGTLLFLLWQGVSYLLLRRKLRCSSRLVTEEKILALLEKETAAVGLQKVLPIYAAEIGSPMIVGAAKPVLLLPEISFTEEQLSLVFRHELTHYRRRDIWYKLLLMLANAVHWFNPMVWLMVRAADRDLELSCDEAVVNGKNEEYREEYGRCLLAVVRAGMNRRTLFTTNFYSGKKTLKNRLSTILDMTPKSRGTLAFMALLLAAAVAGSLVACTPGGDPGRAHGIDLSDMDAVSREYIAPLAAMGDSVYWDNIERLDAVLLLQYASYELYGYKGGENLELSSLYGGEPAKRTELEALHRDDGFYHLPKAEVYAVIEKHFAVDDAYLNACMKRRLADDGNSIIVSAWEMREQCFAYAKEATRRDDLLKIRYGMYEVQPGDEESITADRAAYAESHEATGTYAITIRLTKEGWVYVSRDFGYEEVTLPRPEGEPEPVDLLQSRKVQQCLAGEGYNAEGWTLLGSRSIYTPMKDFIPREDTDDFYAVTGWNENQVSIYRTAEGYAMLYREKIPNGFSGGTEAPVVTKWNESISVNTMTTEEAKPFDFGDMVIEMDDATNGYTLYSPGTDCSILMCGQWEWCTAVVEHSGSTPRFVNRRVFLGDNINDRYSLLMHSRTEDKGLVSDYYAYDRETRRLTPIPTDSGDYCSNIRGSDTLFRVQKEDGSALSIYSAANPEAPLATFDKTNLPLDGNDSVNIDWVYSDDRGGNMLVLIYYPYRAADISDEWYGYQLSSYHWKVLPMTMENNTVIPSEVLTLPQRVPRNYWGSGDMGEVIVRDGLMYYSNYYDENGSDKLEDGSRRWEKWCLNLTTGQARMIYTNDPLVSSYDDEAFIAKAKAMGYTDEMLKIMRDSRVAAADVLTGNGTGSGSEDFYSPGIQYRAYSRTLNKDYDKSMVVLLDSSGSMRVVPQVWNDGYGFQGSNCAFTKLGFTAEGLLWISDDRGVFYYDPAAIMAVAEDRSPVYSWSPSELVTGDDIPYVMLVRGYRAEKRIAVLWSTLPADWDGWSMLPGDTTIHAAVLDSTGQLQNDWDTKINPGCYEEGGPVRLYSNEQKDGYLCFYVDSKHGTGSADYELNLTTGEVNRT